MNESMLSAVQVQSDCRIHTNVVALILFMVCFVYYSFVGYSLPAYVGPDHQMSRIAVKFYLKNQRLAVMPDDLEIITFSKYGNSRAMRPPLSFAVAAVFVKLSPWYETRGFFAYRHASALFCAAAVMLLFLGMMLYFNQLWLALLGSFLVALMPQFAFTGAYLNDDSAALFATFYLFYAMIYLLKRGTSYRGLAHFGLAIGLVVLSKMTAWLILPTAVLFYLLYILRFNQHTVKYHAWLLLFFMLGGGWWCVWNMWHYGLHDPFLLYAEKQWAATYSTINLSKLGYAQENAFFLNLIIDNYRNFLNHTFRAVIGNLDWLRLPMGPVQYNYYFVFFILAFVYLLSHLPAIVKPLFDKQPWRLFSVQKTPGWVPDIKFEVVIVFMVLFQFLMYTWHNIYNDIQLQGKYLLPIVFPFLILSLSFFARLKQLCQYFGVGLQRVYTLSLIVITLLLPFVVHIEAIVNRVVPFYGADLLG